jgi:hypothetical protein
MAAQRRVVICPVPVAGSRSRNRIDVPPVLQEPHQCSIDAVRRAARPLQARSRGWLAAR